MTLALQHEIDTSTYPGFSERFNGFLDLAGVSPANRGREVEMGTLFNASQGSMKNWLEKDKPPLPGSARNYVKILLARMNLVRDPERIYAWLLFGDAIVKNPIESGDSNDLNPTLDGHQWTKKVSEGAFTQIILALSEKARGQGINILEDSPSFPRVSYVRVMTKLVDFVSEIKNVDEIFANRNSPAHNTFDQLIDALLFVETTIGL